MGRPLRFDYHVSSARATTATRFATSAAARAPATTGHTYMCRYISVATT